MDNSLHLSEKILENINETIREQEGKERLRELSQHLWIGHGYITAYLSEFERWLMCADALI
jgi:hypothetical protein